MGELACVCTRGIRVFGRTEGMLTPAGVRVCGSGWCGDGEGKKCCEQRAIAALHSLRRPVDCAVLRGGALAVSS